MSETTAGCAVCGSYMVPHICALVLARPISLVDLPRFVQVRAYDKGLAVARVVHVTVEEGWAWERDLIEGTRLEPEYVAERVAVSDTIEQVADEYGITIEQVEAAVQWCRTSLRGSPLSAPPPASRPRR